MRTEAAGRREPDIGHATVARDRVGVRLHDAAQHHAVPRDDVVVLVQVRRVPTAYEQVPGEGAADGEQRVARTAQPGARARRLHVTVTRAPACARCQRADLDEGRLTQRRGRVKRRERPRPRARSGALPPSRRPQPRNPELRVLRPRLDGSGGERGADEQGKPVGRHGAPNERWGIYVTRSSGRCATWLEAKNRISAKSAPSDVCRNTTVAGLVV